MSEIMRECFWKKLVEDPASTTGEDMRETGTVCDGCLGSNPDCSKYIEIGEQPFEEGHSADTFPSALLGVRPVP